MTRTATAATPNRTLLAMILLLQEDMSADLPRRTPQRSKGWRHTDRWRRIRGPDGHERSVATGTRPQHRLRHRVPAPHLNVKLRRCTACLMEGDDIAVLTMVSDPDLSRLERDLAPIRDSLHPTLRRKDLRIEAESDLDRPVRGDLDV